MSVAVEQEEPLREPERDQRVVFHGVSWTDFELMLRIRGDGGGPRMTYLEGELEIMSPSVDHEGIKTTIGRLLEAYAEENDLNLNGFGSWTVKNPTVQRGAEPDECYMLGSGKPRPDLAIEVIWTSGGLDKLEVYRKLEVPEVWLWKANRISVHFLVGERYVEAETSALLPAIDLTVLVQHIDPENQLASVRAYRQALRA